ncbi:MPND protein, partial [Polypterus senegalus]
MGGTGSESPSPPNLLEEGGELDEEELSPVEDPEGGRTQSSRSSLMTRRGITLRVLLKDGLIEPVNFYPQGKKFIGDLLADGKIRWVETGQLFNSPSAWATYCKKLVNPAKKSGCGWASVKYRGQKLVQYKTTWLHKYQPAAEMTLASEGEDEDLVEEDDEEGKMMPAEEKNRKGVNKNGLDPTRQEGGQLDRRTDPKECVLLHYSALGSRDAGRDPHTLVELTAFSAMNKFQPFNVAVSSNVLLLVICQNLLLRGLALVGWYHSHPYGSAHPSLQDIDSQMDYQLKLQGSSNGFQPCLGLVCSPYFHGNPGVESRISPFWVMPPPEQRPNDYGIPMEVEMTYVQDAFLTSDVLHEMKLLLDYYKTAPDLIKFVDVWKAEKTYLDKLKTSLCSHAPKDQAYSQILQHIFNQLLGQDTGSQ